MAGTRYARQIEAVGVAVEVRLLVHSEKDAIRIGRVFKGGNDGGSAVCSCLVGIIVFVTESVTVRAVIEVNGDGTNRDH